MTTPGLSPFLTLLYGGLRLLGRLSLPTLHRLGSACGSLIWLLDGRLRRVTERNLSLLLTQDGAETRQAIARAVLRETGKSMTEVAIVWAGSPQRALSLVREVRGLEHLEAARAAGRGLIIAAPHLGCWELLNYWLAERMPLSIAYRQPQRPYFEPLLLKARGALQVEQVRAEGAGVRALYRRLNVGGVVGILPDQRPKRGEGEFAPFFGIPAMTMVLLPRLARHTGAPVLFAFAERLREGAGFRIHLLPAPDGIADADLGVACAALNRGVEACVRIAFTQYQWTYKRYSIQPDGRPNPYAAATATDGDED